MKSNYTGIWLLLATAMVVIILIAFADDINIGSWTVKKAPYREALLRDKEQEQREEAYADSVLKVRQELEEQRVATVVTDSTPQSILLIGDSMTMNLALRLAQYAKQNGHTMHAVNWDSSNTIKWGKSDHLKEYIEEYGATYVFISLGANELYLKEPKSHLKYVEMILEQVGDLPYVWIGPPNWKEDFGVNDMLEEACKPGSFFRSAGMEFARKKDGIHPTRESSALWIDSIARWMPKSAHPILLELPSDSIGKGTPNLKFLKATDK